MYQVFQRKTSSESSCKRNFQGQPFGQKLVNITMCTYARTLFSKQKPKNRYRGLSPNTHFYIIALYFRLCGNIGITFSIQTYIEATSSLIKRLKCYIINNYLFSLEVAPSSFIQISKITLFYKRLSEIAILPLKYRSYFALQLQCNQGTQWTMGLSLYSGIKY